MKLFALAAALALAASPALAQSAHALAVAQVMRLAGLPDTDCFTELS
jgi:hypothetical protein